ncbi:MAG TPA: PEP-CTERM sorting domain-containing protein, partial [Verrucomicrobiae bacterium]
LNNDSSSLSPIGTFWFAWVPDVYGYDLLPSTPSSIGTPDGWSAYTTGGDSYYYPDGYGIQFYANGAGLAPGSSIDFQFTSVDSPAVLAATSPYFGLAADSSYIYSTYAQSDPGALVSPQLSAVPEPSALSLLAAAGAALLFLGNRQQLRKFQPVAAKIGPEHDVH